MKRFATYTGIGAAVLLAVLFLTAWLALRSSLPSIDGATAIPGIGASILIQRDSAGVPTITAQTRSDLAFGLGYVHGQDRFFEMDLMRRAAAGELSALLGPALLKTDRELRLHQFRRVARAALAQLDPAKRQMLDAYVNGVNAALASLRSRPFEYWLLRSTPRPWTAEDTVLCVHAMFLQLQDADGHPQLQRGLLRATLPQAAYEFIESDAPEWEAAIDGSHAAEPRIPLPQEFNLRDAGDLPVLPPAAMLTRLAVLGSNNWAVAGARTSTGSALLGNDMHLGYRVPTLWYRARLVQASASDPLDITGVTLPGTPATVAGSNGSIAWGFTNSYGEFQTVVRLVEADSHDGPPAFYRTAAGVHPIRYIDEPIEVAGGSTDHLKVGLTEWGPLVGRDWEGQPYALQWTAQDPLGINFNLLDLEHAHSVQAALRLAPTFGIPGQNLMVADKDGHIGWTIAGRLPSHGPAGSGISQLSTDPAVGFAGWLDADEQPRVIDPPSGMLWSANARVVGGAAATLIGDDGMDRGARAGQIEKDLRNAALPFTPAASLAVQLDDRALFLERWRALLGTVIDGLRAGGSHEFDEAHETLETWSGHAAPEDAAYRLVNAFREAVENRAFYMLVAPARAKAPDFHFVVPESFEGPLWRLMRERPLHLLASRYAGWDQFFLEALRAGVTLPPGCRRLRTCTWGSVNAVHIAHPLSGALPVLAAFLDMPTVIIPGGRTDMPRIQGPDYGASERFSVSPGHEAEAYFHMPGAQSGHPLSPFYRAGFENWAKAVPSPFLPGPTAHSMELTPQSSRRRP